MAVVKLITIKTKYIKVGGSQLELNLFSVYVIDLAVPKTLYT